MLKNQKVVKNWYARMSDEKRAEYNQKWRMARAHKKVAYVISINPKEVSQTHASSSPDVPRTPLSNIANSNTTGSFFIFTCCNFNILTTISIFYATLLYQLLVIIRSNFFFHLEYHKGLEYLDYEYSCPDTKEYVGIVPDFVILQLN